MTEELKHAAKRFAEVLEIMAKNYIASTIADGLTPIIQKTVQALTDDAKDKLGKKEPEKEDKLGDSKGAEQPDLFTVELDGCNRIYDGWGNSFTAYTLYCVRVGTEDDAFFTLGRRYQVMYSCLKSMHGKMKKEDDKMADLPPDCLHGTYCCCLTRHGDLAATERTMKSYLENMVMKYQKTSKALPDHYYMGDKWDVQQRGKAIFDDAFAATKTAVIKGEYTTVLPPFDETEGMIQLLRHVARNEIIQMIREKVPPVPFLKPRLELAADMSVLNAVDAAVGGAWPAIQKGVNVAKDEVLEILDKKADEIADKLKPLLGKVLALVQSKMKKEEKKDDENKDEKKKKTEIGDFVKNWKFDQTDIGKRFWDNLIIEDATKALDILNATLSQAMTEAVEKRLQDGMKRLMGERASMEIVQLIIEQLATDATRMVKRFTTISPLMTASRHFFEKRAEVEKKIRESKTAEEMEKAINEGSAAMWDTLPHIGVRLFKDIETVKSQITSEFNGWTDDSVTPLTDAADAMYAEQMKAINSIRVKLVLKLRTLTNLIGKDNEMAEAVRNAFREFVFNSVNVLVQDSWTAVGNAIVLSGIAQVKAKFAETVWPSIQSGLDELQSHIPEHLSKMGMKLAPIVQKVVNILLEKGTTFVITKLIIKLEELLFNQAEKL